MLFPVIRFVLYTDFADLKRLDFLLGVIIIVFSIFNLGVFYSAMFFLYFYVCVWSSYFMSRLF